MNNRDPLSDEPARIEREIVHTRASLHRKLDEIQHRLNPREQVRARVEQVRASAVRATSAVQSVDPRPYAGVAAAAAVGVGAVMAFKGLRRRSDREAIEPMDVDMMGE